MTYYLVLIKISKLLGENFVLYIYIYIYIYIHILVEFWPQSFTV